jgi:hypothetical protein
MSAEPVSRHQAPVEEAHRLRARGEASSLFAPLVGKCAAEGLPAWSVMLGEGVDAARLSVVWGLGDRG